jgi:hypothetical protein
MSFDQNTHKQWLEKRDRFESQLYPMHRSELKDELRLYKRNKSKWLAVLKFSKLKYLINKSISELVKIPEEYSKPTYFGLFKPYVHKKKPCHIVWFQAHFCVKCGDYSKVRNKDYILNVCARCKC